MPEGGTPAERLDRAFRQILTVPKEELMVEEAAERQAKEKLKGERNRSELAHRTKPLATHKSLGGRQGFKKPGR